MFVLKQKLTHPVKKFPILRSIKCDPITSWSIKNIYCFTKLKRPGIVLALGSVWPRCLKTSATFTMVPGLWTLPSSRFICRQNYSCGGKMTADVQGLLSACFMLHISSWKRKDKRCFYSSTPNKTPEMLSERTIVDPWTNQCSQGKKYCDGLSLSHEFKTKAGGVEGSSSSDFTHFSQCQGLLGGWEEK